MTVSNKAMERIMHQDFNLSPYDGFRIGGIGKVLNQIGLNHRKHHIIYKVSSGEFPIPMEFTGKLMFDVHPRISYNLADQDFSRVLTLHQDFKRKDIMKEGNSISKFPEFSRNSLRTEFSSRMSFSEDRIMGYKGKEKDLLKALTPQEIGQHGLIDSDSLYEESEEEIKNLKETLQELKTMDISEESKLSLENVKRLIQKNFSENPLAWWDRNKIEATLKIKEECKYDSPGFLVRNHGEIKGIFIKDLTKYKKDFRPLLKETKSAKWKWEEIHTQKVLELKQVCNNLPKLAIPHDEDELVVYTDANDYRWAAVLMKKTTTGEEPCRYTGGLITEQQAQVWHINEK
ncbi:hypothetical protein Sango_2812900 [Sesamum angolense]|uniref:Reverse transcriptase/retrotransposon-derived protein RNase H-like domain-containing protein n=1 Tax=Sesamum angolense TaxID=2727404 RepID=A0AAE1W0R7_9LAMI|nr:hypothetical protein Sango_2812900 [Sesamum angolense]